MSCYELENYYLMYELQSLFTNLKNVFIHLTVAQKNVYTEYVSHQPRQRYVMTKTVLGHSPTIH